MYGISTIFEALTSILKSLFNKLITLLKLSIVYSYTYYTSYYY